VVLPVGRQWRVEVMVVARRGVTLTQYIDLVFCSPYKPRALTLVIGVLWVAEALKFKKCA